jgi:hypothetical protein
LWILLMHHFHCAAYVRVLAIRSSED